jgi:hypothetical protein
MESLQLEMIVSRDVGAVVSYTPRAFRSKGKEKEEGESKDATVHHLEMDRSPHAIELWCGVSVETTLMHSAGVISPATYLTRWHLVPLFFFCGANLLFYFTRCPVL